MNKSSLFTNAHITAKATRHMFTTYRAAFSAALKGEYAQAKRDAWLNQPSEQFPNLTNRELAEIEARELAEAHAVFNKPKSVKVPFRRDRPSRSRYVGGAHNKWEGHKFRASR
ncbi:hypothetical protein BBM38_23690 [Vibrio parahaemolyticus]|uniref:hypothetical protein n=1 Tax=Vibrio parahaemolyticus TaxID=670 RepID=UPI00084A3BDE|nr:hypothetical protein [Vibrio parahaemolyticus]ODZ29298.1 hypothetical protein BBM38_23690 [Vibrio parahaemolyticus]ODZ38487.1 hypothetical protein BBM37_08210 [Vibrio parahaemolyticus]